MSGEEQQILDFLAWARDNNIRLAVTGRPPFGRDGTWFLNEYQMPEILSAYMASRKEKPDGVQ